MEQIISKYISQKNRYNYAKEKLDKEMAVLRDKLTALENWEKELQYPLWTEHLLRPILSQIKKQLPDWVYEKGRLTPMGLASRVSVFFYKRGLPKGADKWAQGNSIYIVLLPGELDKGELLYETGATINRFSPGTIGEINGFNRVTKRLESIEEAVTFLQAQANTKNADV